MIHFEEDYIGFAVTSDPPVVFTLSRDHAALGGKVKVSFTPVAFRPKNDYYFKCRRMDIVAAYCLYRDLLAQTADAESRRVAGMMGKWLPAVEYYARTLYTR